MMFQSAHCKRQEGFTLIEVMMALAIFTIGILGIAAMQIRAIQGNASGQRLTEASALAQEAIEQVMEQPFASFAVGSTNQTIGQYTVIQVVAAPPGGSVLTASEALWINVTVNWTDPGGVARNVPVTFIKTKNMEDSYL